MKPKSDAIQKSSFTIFSPVGRLRHWLQWVGDRPLNLLGRLGLRRRQEILLAQIFAVGHVVGRRGLVGLAVDQLVGRVPLHRDHALHGAGGLAQWLRPCRLVSRQWLGLENYQRTNYFHFSLTDKLNFTLNGLKGSSFVGKALPKNAMGVSGRLGL